MHLADLGYPVLVLAFIIAVFSAAASVLGASLRSESLTASGRNGIFVVAGLFTLAMAIMLYAFVTKDYSLKIVIYHASNDLPSLYSLCALYADKAGSLFFWGWLVALFAAILAIQKYRINREVMPYALAILAVVLAFFLALVTFVSDVFEASPQVPADGLGLNPLLQNFGMLIHPPLLYIGFAGFMVVFAYAIGALAARSPSSEWANGIRRWTLFAWCTLGLGNLMGAWWAYEELGWGGYWAWDPVENAGIMPWFLGTAFLHSIAILRKRQYLHVWSFLLIIFTFVFVLLSPFITHGGITSDLHGFKDSPFVPYVHVAMWFSLAVSVGLLIWHRRALIDAEPPRSVLSREAAFVATNIILSIIVVIVVAITAYPKAYEAIRAQAIALPGREWFDLSAGPILLLLVLFIGVCPVLGWKKSSPKAVGRRLLRPLLASAMAAGAVGLSGVGNWYVVAAFVCGFPLFTIVLEWVRGVRARHATKGDNYLIAWPRLVWSNRPRYGGFIVHIGIILITLGVIGSSMYDVEALQTVNRGEVMFVQDYGLTYDGLSIEQSESKVTATAKVVVSRDGAPVATLHPQNNYWFRVGDYYAEVAIRTTPAEDLFVVLADYDMEGPDLGEWAIIRAKVNPLVVWMWIGGGLMLIGGAIAFWPERRGRSPAGGGA